MTKRQAYNTVALLQKEPFYYRNFGIWWWYIKAELKRNGFDKAQLYYLGDFTDPSVKEFYEGLTREQVEHEAWSYQYDHAVHSYNSNLARTPDGDPYLIHDQDVE